MLLRTGVSLLRSRGCPIARQTAASSFSSQAQTQAQAKTQAKTRLEQTKIAMKTIQAGRGLSRSFYTDPSLYQTDLELVWHKEWIFAGHDCELTKPGDWMTLRVGEHPIVIVKGRDEQLRAFHNVCSHRGFPLCKTDTGHSKRRFKCPYHQWTYDLDGTFAFGRDFQAADSGMTKEELSLKPVALEHAGGCMYISLAKEPPLFQPVAELLESYLAPFDLRAAKVAYTSKIIEKCNWKLTWENNRECYHCKTSHPQLCHTFPDGEWWNGVGGTPEQQAAIASLLAACEQRGLPSHYHMSDDMQYRIMRTPLNDNLFSMTLNGMPAVTTSRLGSMPMDEPVGDVLYYHYPSTWNHFTADHAITFRILPLSPTETEVVTKWLVPGDAEEGVDYDLENLTQVWLATNDEDRELVEMNQIGVSSPAYVPGPYHSKHEIGVREFVEWYCSTLEKRISNADAN